VISRRRRKRLRNGASLIEAALAAFILVPIALLFIDVMCLVFANSMNDTAAKNCARAGANQPDVASAGQAADKCLATFQTSGIVKSIDMNLQYTGEGGESICTTTMVVNLPVKFPGFSSVTFTNRAVEPIVGKPDPTKP
jgi:hypothetical protein